jgi:hypothetical protein
MRAKLPPRTQIQATMSRYIAAMGALVFAVDALFLLSVFAGAESQAPPGTKTDGAYFVAYRTPAHISRSSPDVFHGIASDMLDFLKRNEVKIIADPERGTIQTDELFSLDSLLNLTKNAGATSLLYVTVDRPATSWLKVTVQCYDLSGKVLWEEHASATSGLSGKGAPTKTMEHLEKKLLLRIGQPGLPKVQKATAATTTGI